MNFLIHQSPNWVKLGCDKVQTSRRWLIVANHLEAEHWLRDVVNCNVRSPMNRDYHGYSYLCDHTMMPSLPCLRFSTEEAAVTALERVETAFAERNLRRPHIRWMIRRDMAEVLQIEGATSSHPWDEETFLACLRQRNCIGMVCEVEEKVLGYMIYELHKHKLHLLNLAVSPEYARKGLGRLMVEKLISKLSTHRRVEICVHVRESSLSSHLFFKKNGFKAPRGKGKAVLKRACEDTKEDLYILQYFLATGENGVEDPSLALNEGHMPSNRVEKYMRAAPEQAKTGEDEVFDEF